MKPGLLSLVLVFGAVVHAGDPALAPAKPAPPNPPPKKPLDLRVGDVRNYMLPEEFGAAITAPDPDTNTIVVHGYRLLAMKSLQPIPAGFPPATLWWALRNPSQSWRIILPDLNAPAAGPTVDKVPPPIFRWGP